MSWELRLLLRTMTAINQRLFNRTTAITPLVFYRVVFGFLMMASQIRFYLKGWVVDCFFGSNFQFKYQFFEWVQPLQSISQMKLLVLLCAFFAFCIALGFMYRLTSVLFLISFTYLELIEKAWYLNHYYFVSLVAFLLCLMPAHRYFSIDSWLWPKIKQFWVPVWTITSLKVMMSLVYFFAAIAKINPDWMLANQPLKIWLTAQTELPILNVLFSPKLSAALFSYGGFFYDFTIPFLLWNKKTRPYAFVLVVFFHVMTAVLFQIGMFPWIMLMGSLIFVSHEEWAKIFKGNFPFKIEGNLAIKTKTSFVLKGVLALFFLLQIALPLRKYFYNENHLWTERNYRFAWHVMLMEKNGYTEFTVIDSITGRKWKEVPKKRLTEVQNKQMSFQPDMIWEYALYLERIYREEKNVKDPIVYVYNRVSLNGRSSQELVPADMDLTKIKNHTELYNNLVPLKEER